MKRNNKLDNLLRLQELWRKGMIEEKDIPREQLQELKKLYNLQIHLLETSIEEDKKKILKIKNQL